MKRIKTKRYKELSKVIEDITDSIFVEFHEKNIKRNIKLRNCGEYGHLFLNALNRKFQDHSIEISVGHEPDNDYCINVLSMLELYTSQANISTIR